MAVAPPLASAAELMVPLKPLPSDLLPPLGTSPNLSAEQLEVLCAIYNLYCADTEAQQQAALNRHYAAGATFEDNFIQASGRDQISTIYYALRRCCHHMALALEKVELLDAPAAGNKPALSAAAAASHAAGDQVYQLQLLGRHSFFLPHTIRGPLTALVLPAALEVWTTDTLTVQAADQRVIHHQQRVHNLPVLPWLIRWQVGLALCLFLMHVLGW